MQITRLVRRLTRWTGIFLFAVLVGVLTPNVNPNVAEALNNRDLFVSSQNNSKVVRYNGTTGGLIGDFVTSGLGGLDQPHGLVFGPDGNLYVSSLGNNKVVRYSGTTGALIGDFVTTGSGGLNGPTFLIFAPQQATPVPAKPSEVPEADTLLLMGGGIGGLAVWLRWQWSKQRAWK